eukprot:1175717-Prorocentrum_minimum.AAC.2
MTVVLSLRATADVEGHPADRWDGRVFADQLGAGREVGGREGDRGRQPPRPGVPSSRPVAQRDGAYIERRSSRNPEVALEPTP